jgi:hypothetical protein
MRDVVCLDLRSKIDPRVERILEQSNKQADHLYMRSRTQNHKFCDIYKAKLRRNWYSRLQQIAEIIVT